MGLFSWLFPEPDPVKVTDLIWLNAKAKLRAIQNEVAQADSVLVLAHFPKTLNEVEEELADFTRHQGAFTRANLLELKREVVTLLAKGLQPDEFAEPVAPDATIPLILVAERHLLRARDDHIVDFVRGLGVPCRVRFHLSLDDALLSLFAGASVQAQLVSLGMEEDKPIESKMVARRLKAAQAKLARSVVREEWVDSGEEWLRQNLAE